MPATVLITESTRRTVRTLLVIAAIVVVLIPLSLVTASGASRLGYTRVEASESLPGGIDELRLELDTGAPVTVSASRDAEPSITLTGVGPRAETPSLDIRSSGASTTVAVSETSYLENSQIQITLPSEDAKAMSLQIDGEAGSIDVDGEYKDITTSSDSASVTVHGSAERVTATTDWGGITVSGVYDSLDLRADTGTIDGYDLTVRDKVDASATIGEISLGFTNDSAPLSGISATTDEGAIDVSLPRLDMVERRMAADDSATPTGRAADGPTGSKDDASADQKDGSEPAGDGQDSTASAKALVYQINAASSSGSVDVARSLRGYDVGRKADLTGKTVIPVTVTTDIGMVTVDQN